MKISVHEKLLAYGDARGNLGYLRGEQEAAIEVARDKVGKALDDLEATMEAEALSPPPSGESDMVVTADGPLEPWLVSVYGSACYEHGLKRGGPEEEAARRARFKAFGEIWSNEDGG